MKLRSIEAFCAAVEEKSISAAARRMYLTQPTVSERLAELERETRVPLLRRSRHGVQLTGEGAAFYEQAQKVLDEMKVLHHRVQDLRGIGDTKLRFAACVMVGERLLPEWLGRFKKQTPNVVPIVLMGNDSAVLAALRSGDTPIGIVACDGNRDGFESTTVVDDELVLVVAPTHPWARRRVSLEDLPSEPFIAREHGSTIRTVVEQTLKDMGNIALDIQMELNSNTAVKKATESGLGFSLLSRADVRRKLEAGTLVQVEGLSIPWSFKLIRCPSTSLTEVEKSFYKFILGMRKQEDTEPVKTLVNCLGE